MIGFVAAALSFSGLVLPGEAWRQLAVASAIVSLLGITLFFGTWPVFNTVAAIAVDATVLFTQVALRWPPQAMYGG
jgi:divalent metal cation (Fe/Co/Zn/Cd) transporter